MLSINIDVPVYFYQHSSFQIQEPDHVIHAEKKFKSCKELCIFNVNMSVVTLLSVTVQEHACAHTNTDADFHPLLRVPFRVGF